MPSRSAVQVPGWSHVKIFVNLQIFSLQTLPVYLQIFGSIYICVCPVVGLCAVSTEPCPPYSNDSEAE